MLLKLLFRNPTRGDLAILEMLSRRAKLSLLLQLLLVGCALVSCTPNADYVDVHHLDLDHRIAFTSEARVGFRTETLRIYCFAGLERRLGHTFRAVRLRLHISDDEHYAQYVGHTPDDVRAHYEAKRSLFSWSHLLGSVGSRRQSDVRLAAFNQTCVGIETAQPYTVRLHVVRLDLLRFGMFVAGLLLFCTAHRLTRTPFFYYSSGVGLGVTLSVFLVVWLIGRQLPKRSLMLGTIVGGWALLWYCAQLAWDNARSLLHEHQIYVFYYVCAAGLVSFVACYRVGPPTNQRSIDIVRWSLQLAASALIYLSSEYAEFTVAALLGLIVWCYVPWHTFGWLRAAWRRRFPPPRRLLTAEEYEEQARETTRQELAKMVEWCGSPESRPWAQVARLRDPKRFAEFVERGVHVTEEEQFDHTHSMMEADAMDETSDEDECGEAQHPAAEVPEISDDEDADEVDYAAVGQTRSPAYGWQVPVLRTPVTRSNGRISRGRNQMAEISSDDD